MDILLIILSMMIISIGTANANNTTEIFPERASAYCYYCSNCPRPFTSSSPSVRQVSSNTGWCAMMSTTSSPDGIYTRGVAQPGLCYSNGCSWRNVTGVRTWVCCCNQNLCNSYVPTTTPRPSLPTCYYCSNCPRPFTSSSIYVTTVVSNTGWCAKMSTSSSRGAVATRGIAQPGLCNYNECSWKNVNGVNTWVCCCNRYLCNTGVYGSQSTLGIFSTSLVMLFMVAKII